MVEYGPRWIHQPHVDYGETIVQVSVGSGQIRKVFKVHKKLLCAVSDYFTEALNGLSSADNQEIESASIFLEEEEPCTFEVFQRWVYSGKVEQASSYAGGDDLHEDQFWLRVYLLSVFLKVRAVQVIAFERFETVFPCKKPIVLPSKEFIRELYKYQWGRSKWALQAYVARHSAYWMLRDMRKADKWKSLLASNLCYGMDVSICFSKLLPMLAREPESFDFEHPAHSRGEFAIEYNLNLQALRKEANDRMRAMECDVTIRPQLGMFWFFDKFPSNADFEPETLIDSQSQNDQMPTVPSPRHDTQEDQASLAVLVRPRKRIRTSLNSIDSTVVDHTIEEESL